MPREPSEIEPYPWLHPDAVEYLEGLLTPEMRVLEHGGGGSTLWFAERVKRVVTTEGDPDWCDALWKLAPMNVTITSNLPYGSYYDLFFIDGDHEGRGRCIEQAHLYVKTGGWLVLDNANRPEYAPERRLLHEYFKLVARFDNNIPISKFFITEFWKCE